jgi:hypothetical protein
VGQQARNLLMGLGERASRFQLLTGDQNSWFTEAIGALFAGVDIRITRAPVRTPRRTRSRNGSGTLRRKCLDHLLITGPDPSAGRSRALGTSRSGSRGLALLLEGFVDAATSGIDLLPATKTIDRLKNKESRCQNSPCWIHLTSGPW